MLLVAELFIQLFNQALMILGFRIEVDAYKQYIVRIISITVSAEILLLLNLFHGILSTHTILEFNEQNRKVHAPLRCINQIGTSFTGLQFTESFVFSLGAPHKTGYKAEHHGFFTVIGKKGYIR